MLAPLNIFLPAISSLPKYFSPEYCPHHPATVTAPCQPHTWLQIDFLKTSNRCNSPQKDWIYSVPLATWSPNLVLWMANIFATSHATVIHKHTRCIVPLQHSLSVCCFLFLSYVCFLRPWRSLQQAANVSWRHSTLKRSRIPSNFSYHCQWHWTNSNKHLFGVRKNYDPIILTVFWQCSAKNLSTLQPQDWTLWTDGFCNIHSRLILRGGGKHKAVSAAETEPKGADSCPGLVRPKKYLFINAQIYNFTSLLFFIRENYFLGTLPK